MTPRLRRLICWAFVLVSMFVFIIGQPNPVHAAGPWYVRTDGNNAKDCLSPTNACATINAAIQKAAPADTIFVAAGVYTSVDAQVVLINKSIYLSGGWDNTFILQEGQSIIDGELTTAGITVKDNSDATIDRFTIDNYQSGSGFTNHAYGIYIEL